MAIKIIRICKHIVHMQKKFIIILFSTVTFIKLAQFNKNLLIKLLLMIDTFLIKLYIKTIRAE